MQPEPRLAFEAERLRLNTQPYGQIQGWVEP